LGLKSQAAFEAQAVDFLEKDEMRFGTLFYKHFRGFKD
jgi:hypothetical protein